MAREILDPRQLPDDDRGSTESPEVIVYKSGGG